MTSDRFKAPATATTILEAILKRLPDDVLEYDGFDFSCRVHPASPEYVVFAFKPPLDSRIRRWELVRTPEKAQAQKYVTMLRDHAEALRKLLA